MREAGGQGVQCRAPARAQSARERQRQRQLSSERCVPSSSAHAALSSQRRPCSVLDAIQPSQAGAHLFVDHPAVAGRAVGHRHAKQRGLLRPEAALSGRRRGGVCWRVCRRGRHDAQRRASAAAGAAAQAARPGGGGGGTARGLGCCCGPALLLRGAGRQAGAASDCCSHGVEELRLLARGGPALKRPIEASAWRSA